MIIVDTLPHLIWTTAYSTAAAIVPGEFVSSLVIAARHEATNTGLHGKYCKMPCPCVPALVCCRWPKARALENAVAATSALDKVGVFCCFA